MSKEGEAEKPAYKRSARETEAVNKVYGKRTEPRLKISGNSCTAHHSDTVAGLALIIESIGPTDRDFGEGILAQLVMAAGGSSGEADVNFMLAFIKDVKPGSCIETVLATQMALTHLASMRYSRHLHDASAIMVCESNARILDRLMRTFALQAETLKHLRNDSGQTVTVKHVNINKSGSRRRQSPVRSARNSGFGAAAGASPQQNPMAPDLKAVTETIPIAAARSNQK
jgi:hypothetical protein